jgi:hypothetical protein
MGSTPIRDTKVYGVAGVLVLQLAFQADGREFDSRLRYQIWNTTNAT